MMSEIESGAAKTKQAIQDAGETVADTAKSQGSRLEKMVRFGMKALPLLPERSFEFMLDRMGLARKRNGFASFALFAGGFAAGSVVTAFSTPVSGPALRKKVWNLTKSIGDDVEEKAEELASAAVSAEKRIVQGAKDLVSGSDPVNDAKDFATDVKNGAKDLATDAKNGIKNVATDAKNSVKDMGADGKGAAKDYAEELKSMKQGLDSRTATDGGRNGNGGYSA